MSSRQLSYYALDGTETDRNRDRISRLGDRRSIAGVRSAARDAVLVLMATRRSSTPAGRHFIVIAIAGGLTAWPGFRALPRELADQSLPPFLSADYALQSGRGLRTDGRVHAASLAEAAVQTAQQHGFHQFLHESRWSSSSHAPVRGVEGGTPNRPVGDIAEVVDAVATCASGRGGGLKNGARVGSGPEAVFSVLLVQRPSLPMTPRAGEYTTRACGAVALLHAVKNEGGIATRGGQLGGGTWRSPVWSIGGWGDSFCQKQSPRHCRIPRGS
jgi:hypothetical protein